MNDPEEGTSWYAATDPSVEAAIRQLDFKLRSAMREIGDPAITNAGER